MSVTEERPTKVGQRVQEIYADTRGWVTYLNENGEAAVAWDTPDEHDETWFPVDDLRVVEVIQVDLDWYNDPSTSPFVEMVTNADQGPDEIRYTWVGGGVSVGIDNARVSLLTRCIAGKSDD